MSKEVHFTLQRETPITEEEIAMIEAAGNMPAEYDEDNPEIDPINMPELYSALIEAVGKRNRRMAKRRA